MPHGATEHPSTLLQGKHLQCSVAVVNFKTYQVSGYNLQVSNAVLQRLNKMSIKLADNSDDH
jgi:hypothetical protein